MLKRTVQARIYVGRCHRETDQKEQPSLVLVLDLVSLFIFFRAREIGACMGGSWSAAAHLGVLDEVEEVEEGRRR
jgi:hypothetical protein